MPVVQTIVKDEEDNTSNEIKAQKKPEVKEPEVTEEPEVVEEVVPEIDYKAELEKTKARLAKAEFTLYKKNKEEKKAEPVEVSPVAQEVAKVLEAQQLRDAEDVFEEELFNMTQNDDERELIRLRYENSIVKTGHTRSAIRQDLEDARFLANRAKFEKVNSEMAKTIVSKRTTGNNGTVAGQQKAQASADLSKQFTKADWEYMKQQKFTKEQIQNIIDKRK